MRGKLHVIEPDGQVRLLREYLDEAFDTEDAKKAVGGQIEIVPRFGTVALPGTVAQPCVVFCNEDGKAFRLELNPFATSLWSEAAGVPMQQILRGPIAVVTGDGSFLADVV